MKTDTERLSSFSLNKTLGAVLPGSLWKTGPLVPVLRFSGTIGAATPLRQGLTLSACANAIERAFSMDDAQAVAVVINSPGGSPVQSRFIYERIRTLATEKSRKVFVFIEDVGASGGYLLALAGDEIYADASSIVGSIGVISGAFGFVEFINRLGIERRLYTAGEKKSTLDPFKPEDPEEVGRLKRILEIIHDEFIALVKERRGQKLAGGGHNLFTGEFWTGRQALELGLIDGIMDIRTKMRALYGEEVRLKLVSAERGLFRRRGTGVGGFHGLEQATNSAGGTLVRDAISALEERAMWAKYGL